MGAARTIKKAARIASDSLEQHGECAILLAVVD